MRTRGLAGLLLLTLVPTLLGAEVMDKESSVREIWSSVLLVGLVAVLAYKYLPLSAAGFVGLACRTLSAVLLFGVYQELADPHVGPAILREAGPGYVTQFHFAAITAGALQCVGIASWLCA